MTKRWKTYLAAPTVGLLAAVVLGQWQVQADSQRFVGVVVSTDHATTPTVQVKSKGMETRTVHTDGKTLFRKYWEAKGWRDSKIDVSELTEGGCVDVEMRSDDASVAKRIRLSAYRAGSLYDPCRGSR